MYFAFRYHTYYIKPLQETGTKEERFSPEPGKKKPVRPSSPTIKS
jgi:hypothetical protein